MTGSETPTAAREAAAKRMVKIRVIARLPCKLVHAWDEEILRIHILSKFR
jgi:hypothetical protein